MNTSVATEKKVVVREQHPSVAFDVLRWFQDVSPRPDSYYIELYGTADWKKIEQFYLSNLNFKPGKEYEEAREKFKRQNVHS